MFQTIKLKKSKNGCLQNKKTYFKSVFIHILLKQAKRSEAIGPPPSEGADPPSAQRSAPAGNPPAGWPGR